MSGNYFIVIYSQELDWKKIKSKADKRLHKEFINHSGNHLYVARKCNLEGISWKKTELEVNTVLIDSTRLLSSEKNHWKYWASTEVLYLTIDRLFQDFCGKPKIYQISSIEYQENHSQMTSIKKYFSKTVFPFSHDRHEKFLKISIPFLIPRKHISIYSKKMFKRNWNCAPHRP